MLDTHEIPLGWTNTGRSIESNYSTRSDRKQLENLGYLQSLPRSLTSFENLLSSIGSFYFIGGVQSLLKAALTTGGSAPTLWNWIICSFAILTISASLAEICSLYPVAGSVYFWASKTGGQKYGPILSWFAALFNFSAWLLICTADALAAANFIISEPVVHQISFPNSRTDLSFRSVEFGIALGVLILAALINGLPHRYIGYSVKATAFLMVILYLMNMIWLPIGVSRTYGFYNTSYVFTSINNGNGASTTYNWFINILFPMYTLLGFDAASHFAEETKHSKTAAPKGMFGSSLWSTIFSFPLMLLFLYADPTDSAISTISGNLAQPIAAMYYFALGKNPHTIVIALSSILYILNTVLAMMSASRSAFAFARDGLFPKFIATVDKNQEPTNAVACVFFAAALLLTTTIPSSVAYISITSGSVICLCFSYALVLFGRLFITWPSFQSGAWSLGSYSYSIGLFAFFWCVFTMITLSLPQSFPIIYKSFNYAPVIFFGILLIGIFSWLYSGRYWFKGPVQSVDTSATQCINLLDSSETTGTSSGPNPNNEPVIVAIEKSTLLL